MENMKLYQITNGFMKLLDEKQTEEMTPEEIQKIGEELSIALQQKSSNIIAYYQEQNALLNAIDEQIRRLQDYKKSTKNKIDNYKDYVKNNMNILGIDKIQTELGTISIANSPLSVEIVDVDKIPDEYKKVVTEINVDKNKIKDNFKSTGEVVDGVMIITNSTYLKIK